jgi:flagellar biosynthesis protein FlhF
MPARARVLRQFAAMGVDPHLARELAASMKAAQSARDEWRLPLSRFADRLPLASRDLADLGGVYAFVGPTGVGKTTTIAKIAARHVMKHGAESVALISTDTYRIGARDQLLTFARILGTPMHSVADARDLRRVLDGLGGKKLVLIDTAGMSQRDVRLAEQFTTLRVDGGDVRSVLVLSAATERGALDEAIGVFRSAEPKALVVTKIDEAALLGPVLSLAIESRLPLVYLSDGQRVPEDLHVAGSKRVWLMQAAVQRSRNRPSQLSEDDLAERFGSPELAERLGSEELVDA